jgi:hypothetical protein
MPPVHAPAFSGSHPMWRARSMTWDRMGNTEVPRIRWPSTAPRPSTAEIPPAVSSEVSPSKLINEACREPRVGDATLEHSSSNLEEDPEAAARAYRERIVGPYRESHPTREARRH